MYDKKPFRFYDCSKIDCARFGNDYCECEYNKNKVELDISIKHPYTNEKIGNNIIISSLQDALEISKEDYGSCSLRLQKDVSELICQPNCVYFIKEIETLIKDIVKFVISQFNIKFS